MDPTLTIGRLARKAGVNVETVRYYERRGLIARPPRAPNSVRRYGAEALARLRFIKRAQQLGFSLEEIAQLLRLERTRSCRAAHDLASQKLLLVDARLADLRRLRRVLAGLIAQCEVGEQRGRCPIIESLTD
ncbi:MAG: Hg(II)-responsive transcriptional regulator [Betaproteobacteria bacterium]|nr:Hg(II)-responsive transcriptional regulator [Betaproteobacteria bacterium]